MLTDKKYFFPKIFDLNEKKKKDLLISSKMKQSISYYLNINRK